MAKAGLYCLSVWNDVKDLSVLPSTGTVCSVPKASAKVMHFLLVANFLERKNSIFFKHFLRLLVFNNLHREEKNEVFRKKSKELKKHINYREFTQVKYICSH